MAVARIVWWKFKPGTRDEAVKRIDGKMDEIKSNEGYQGFLMLLSMNNPDRATVVSIWENEQTMARAETTQYPKVVAAVSDLTTEAPQVAHQNVHNIDIAKIFA
jgi:heme-degrading monooxygenase HmoA